MRLLVVQICAQCTVVKSWYGCVVPDQHSHTSTTKAKNKMPPAALTMVSGVDESSNLFDVA